MDKRACRDLAYRNENLYKHSQAGWPGCRDENLKMMPQAIFNNCQNNKIVPASRMTFSYTNTKEIHPAHRDVSISGPAQPDFHIISLP
jgi:hypothetical protein